jgi:hypothetical protein
MLITDMRYTTRSWATIGNLWVVLPLVLGLAVMGALTSERDGASTRTVSGAPVNVGNGTARAYVTWDDGKPVEIGIALSEQALHGLSGAVEGAHPEHLMQRYDLPLPAGLPAPYKAVELGWNPMGHEPPGIYDRAHFDFHFYTITAAERDAILPSDPQFQQKAERYPEAPFVPAGYFAPAPMAVPQMGVHWLDKKTPEINGQPFTTTFLYGSYDGRVIFAEPMITKALIETKKNYRFEVGTAQQRTAGHWPSSYTITWDERKQEYRIALTELHTN